MPVLELSLRDNFIVYPCTIFWAHLICWRFFHFLSLSNFFASESSPKIKPGKSNLNSFQRRYMLRNFFNKYFSTMDLLTHFLISFSIYNKWCKIINQGIQLRDLFCTLTLYEWLDRRGCISRGCYITSVAVADFTHHLGELGACEFLLINLFQAGVTDSVSASYAFVWNFLLHFSFSICQRCRHWRVHIRLENQNLLRAPFEPFRKWVHTIVSWLCNGLFFARTQSTLFRIDTF